MCISSKESLRCASRAISKVGSDEDPRIVGMHAHGPDGRKLDTAVIRSWLKENAKDQPSTAPRTLVVEALNRAKPTTSAVLPSAENLARTVRRVRRSGGVAIPKTLTELELPDSYMITNDNQNFLLYDGYLLDDEEDRLIIFGTEKNMKLLEESDSVHADGTFDVASPLFKQLYTIHGEKYHFNVSIIINKNYFFHSHICF